MLSGAEGTSRAGGGWGVREQVSRACDAAQRIEEGKAEGGGKEGEGRGNDGRREREVDGEVWGEGRDMAEKAWRVGYVRGSWDWGLGLGVGGWRMGMETEMEMAMEMKSVYRNEISLSLSLFAWLGFVRVAPC